MELKHFLNKPKALFSKYKYTLIVLLIGLGLLLLPEKQTKSDQVNLPVADEVLQIESEALSDILEAVDGAGRVQVLLSIARGEKTVYQTDNDSSGSGDNQKTKSETVIITDSQKNEYGLINQIESPVYQGAIVVCQGADSPSVRLSITQAVSRITGLSTDNICVLKMK